MMRQSCKQILTLLGWLLLAAGAQAESLVTAVVTDPLTGVAIDGYDAVSYFVGGTPEEGLPDYEYVWNGVPWYFANAANRDVFMRDPAVYAPQFGGHCVTSLARGYVSDGKPQLYVLEALKLYLFYSSANRDAFLLARSATVATAERQWARLAPELPGPGAAEAVWGVTASVAPADAGVNLQSN